MHIQDIAAEFAGTMDSTAAVEQPSQWPLSETYWPKVTNKNNVLVLNSC